MLVNKDNFVSLLPDIERDIQQSHLVAIDYEFTGLSTKAERIDLLDTPQARFTKLRSSVMTFQPCQVGICCFILKDGVVVAKPYTFYVFWQASFGLDRVFSCQASSLSFLSKNSLDFNEWINMGIDYLSHDEQAILESRADLFEDKDIEIDSENKVFVEESM